MTAARAVNFNNKCMKVVGRDYNEGTSCLPEVSKFIKEQNEQGYAPQGLLITDPKERGLNVIEISTLNKPAATQM